MRRIKKTLLVLVSALICVFTAFADDVPEVREPLPLLEEEQNLGAQPKPDAPEEAPLSLPANPEPLSVLTTPATEPVPSEPAAADSNEMPTASVEHYLEYQEALHKKHYSREWSVSLVGEPRAFRSTNFRASPYRGQQDNAGFFGVQLQGEKILFRKWGVLSLGAELSLFGAPENDSFEYTMPAALALGPYLEYQVAFANRQPVIPFGKAGFEVMRYRYLFNSARIEGYRVMPRLDAGVHLNLGIFDKTAENIMHSNLGWRSAFLTAAYTWSFDSRKKDIDLSDSGIKVGVRVEF